MDLSLQQFFNFLGPMMMLRGSNSDSAHHDTKSSMANMFWMILWMTLSSLLQNMSRKHILYRIVEDTFGAFMKRKFVHKISARLSFRQNTIYNVDIPKTYFAIQKVLYDTITSERLDGQMKPDYCIEEIPCSYSCDETCKIVVFTNNRTSFTITKDILISHSIDEKISDNNQQDFTYFTYTFRIVSKNNNYGDIQRFVQDCLDKFENGQLDTKHQTFILERIEKTSPGYEISYQSVPFDTTKTFDNMFFESKKDLMLRIEFFEKNESHYRRLGIPYTFGMMFHGQPGTGKTSAIKAIANFTKRHIVIVPANRVRTLEKLKRVFLEQEMNLMKIPMNKRLYVFEEIDCGAWKDIVKARSTFVKNDIDSKSVSQGHTEISTLATLLKGKASNSTSSRNGNLDLLVEDKKDTGTPISLGDLLELLDGIIEMPGRMIVMTSNHPESLDPSLLRPGRIDMILEFKKLTKIDVAQMYKLWFDTSIPSHVYCKMKDYELTQADVGNLFATHYHALDKIHVSLVSHGKS